MACLSPANRPSARAVVGVVLVSLGVATACGKSGAPPTSGASSGSTSPAGPDLSTPEAALACASRALEAGDFEALRACSTADGIERVRRDLLAWNALLSDATVGPRARSSIPPPRDDAEATKYVAGFKGDLSGLLHMLARTQASDAGPVAQPEIARPAAGVDRVETDRVLAGGTRRRTVLVRQDGAWKVDRLTL